MKPIGMLLLCMALGIGTVRALPSGGVAGIQGTQQAGTCTGVVKDVTGETIIGASVVVKGTSNGVITDIDGNFQLRNVKPGDIIQITYVGFIPQEVEWEGKPLNVILKEDTELLDEVVVVGYATVKKANLTGAVSAVDEEVLESRPIVNLGQGLQGTIPNLNITTSGCLERRRFRLHLRFACRLRCRIDYYQGRPEEPADARVARRIHLVEQSDDASQLHELHRVHELDEQCLHEYQ